MNDFLGDDPDKQITHSPEAARCACDRQRHGFLHQESCPANPVCSCNAYKNQSRHQPGCVFTPKPEAARECRITTEADGTKWAATIAPKPEAAGEVLTREEFERELAIGEHDAPLLAHDAALRAALKNAEEERDGIIRRLAAACGNPALEGHEDFFGQLDVEYAVERIEQRDVAETRVRELEKALRDECRQRVEVDLAWRDRYRTGKAELDPVEVEQLTEKRWEAAAKEATVCMTNEEFERLLREWTNLGAEDSRERRLVTETIRLRAVEERVKTLEKIIEEAPHGEGCLEPKYTHGMIPDGPCDCWKAAAMKGEGEKT